mgnify:FL=1
MCFPGEGGLHWEPMTPPSPRPRRPIPEVPTTTQLGVTPTRIMLRGGLARCPVCGSGGQFQRWFQMRDRCRNCDLRYERVEGHWIGYIGVNTVVVMGLMLIVLAVVTFTTAATDGDLPYGQLMAALVAIAVLGPLLFFPSSRMSWTALDLLMRPLRPGEVDPRYVLVDPPRDQPTGP